jgi:hypothetical protein
MVNDSSGTSVWGSGIEQVMQGFYKLSLRPLLEKIEASILVNLMTAAERDRMDVAFDFDALLRADVKSRYESYRIAITNGLMTPNEARAMEHLPEKDGGDQLLIQGAMAPVDGLGQSADHVAPVADPMTDINDKLKQDEMQRLMDEVKSLRTLVQTSTKSAPTPPPVINNYVNLPEQKNVTNVNTPDIKNVINVPENNVVVEAVMPELKQVNPTVNVYNDVKPSDVTVVDNHPKRAVQTVERDANDEISKTIITYEK